MARIAVLLSGEYRKLDVARKTMGFLDADNVDVYVSTWDRTIYKSEKIGLCVEEEVNQETIAEVLGVKSTIQIDKHTLVDEIKYNSRMINRWIAGFNLIKSSGIEYNYVLITRPDLYFRNGALSMFDNIEQYNDSIGVVWADSIKKKKLADIAFLSTYKNIETLMSNISVNKWLWSKENDWHIWWYNFVNQYFNDKIINLEGVGDLTFCRYWADNTHSFNKVLDIHHDWRDLRLLHECDMFGDSFADSAWPPEILIGAKEKWVNGYFEKYK